MDAKEVDAIVVAESVDVFFFSKLSFPRAIGDADFPCCHYRNMKMVQESLQNSLGPESSSKTSFFIYQSYFHFPSFFNGFQGAHAFYRKLSYHQPFPITRQPWPQNWDPE